MRYALFCFSFSFVSDHLTKRNLETSYRQSPRTVTRARSSPTNFCTSLRVFAHGRCSAHTYAKYCRHLTTYARRDATRPSLLPFVNCKLPCLIIEPSRGPTPRPRRKRRKRTTIKIHVTAIQYRTASIIRSTLCVSFFFLFFFFSLFRCSIITARVSAFHCVKN